MANCIFCQIIAGNVPSKKLFEDDKVIAILDIYPASPGHILLIPKQHYMFMGELPAELISHMGIISQRMSHILVTNLKAAGTSVVIQSGPESGQKAPHFIMHIIPRFEKDGLSLAPPAKKIAQDDIDDLYSQLKPLILQTFPGQALEDIPGKGKDHKHNGKASKKLQEKEPEEKEAGKKKPDDILDKIEDLL